MHKHDWKYVKSTYTDRNGDAVVTYKVACTHCPTTVTIA